eukprot:1706069-Prymnesium_polylepis.2
MPHRTNLSPTLRSPLVVRTCERANRAQIYGRRPFPNHAMSTRERPAAPGSQSNMRRTARPPPAGATVHGAGRPSRCPLPAPAARAATSPRSSSSSPDHLLSSLQLHVGAVW